ncbi:MAG: hypothetical protein ACOYMN_18800 [Roseimicrobium sp.]
MKPAAPLCACCVAVLAVNAACAQVAIPATPKNFSKRNLGDGLSTGGSINLTPPAPPSEPKVRYITHVSLSEARQWQSNDGKSLLGKLIAFEDVTVEVAKGAPVPAFTPPANPTVIRDGMVRLLINGKPYELKLERLRAADRSFIEQVATAVAKKVPK